MSFGIDLGGGLSLNTSTGGIGMDLGNNLVLDINTGSIGQEVGDTGITIFPDVGPAARKSGPSAEPSAPASAKPKGFWARLFGG